MHFEKNLIYHVFNQGNNKQPIFFERENYLYFLRKMRKYLRPNADILCYCLMPNHFHWLIVPKDSGVAEGTAIKGMAKIAGTSKVPAISDARTKMAGTSKVPTTSDARTRSKMAGTSKVPAISRQQRLTQDIGTLLSSYTKAINKRQGRSGSLFRGRTKAKNGVIDDFITVDGLHKELLFRPDNDYARKCFQYIHNNPVKANLVVKATDWEFSSAKEYAGLRKGSMCNLELAASLIDLG